MTYRVTKAKFVQDILELFPESDMRDIEQDTIYINPCNITIHLNKDNSTFSIDSSFEFPETQYWGVDTEYDRQFKLLHLTREQLRMDFKRSKLEGYVYEKYEHFPISVIGYYNKRYSLRFVANFVAACNKALASFSPAVYSKLIMDKMEDTIKKEGFIINDDYSYKYWRWDEETIISPYDPFTTQSQTISKIINANPFEKIDEPERSVTYLFGKTSSGQVVAVDRKLCRHFFNICDLYCLNRFEYFTDAKRYLCIKGELSALVSLEKNADLAINSEYALLIRKFECLKRFKPSPKIESLEFSNLSSKEFENLCFDILERMGFNNVHIVGKTNSADGGKDLLATEQYATLLGNEKRKWIWQCKHSKKSLNRKDISEIDELLRENNAQAYGLFCSNDLTPGLITRLEMKEGQNTRIKYFGRIELQAFLSQHPDLISKYNLWDKNSLAYGANRISVRPIW